MNLMQYLTSSKYSISINSIFNVKITRRIVVCYRINCRVNGSSGAEKLNLSREMNKRSVGSPDTESKWKKVCGGIHI